MKTSAATAPDLARSVIAVPPLARLPNLELNPGANRALIRHLDEGGVTTLMYGGNANFYNVGLYEYAAILDFLEHAVDSFHPELDMGQVAVGAAVGYIPLRLLDLEGLPKWPKLKSWYDKQLLRPSFKNIRVKPLED